jgi:inosine-uridine nucleoside N-ribohydrolase
VVDLWQRTGKAANARVATEVDAPAFLELLIERYAALG